MLAEAGATITRFFNSGVAELKDKLGPINWQFLPTKKFEPADFEAFLKLLPREIAGRPLRHAVEVRHESFRTPAFIALARRHGVAVVIAGDSSYPQIADLTAPFVYARIMGTEGGRSKGLFRCVAHALGGAGACGRRVAGRMDWNTSISGADDEPRDVFLYVISGHKVHNPAAGIAIIERLNGAKA